MSDFKKLIPKKILWVDLEMTGLDPQKDVILEVAAEITDFDFNTISGLILEELKSIPKEGDKLSWMNYEFEIIDMDGPRIDKVLLRKVE